MEGSCWDKGLDIMLFVSLNLPASHGETGAYLINNTRVG